MNDQEQEWSEAGVRDSAARYLRGYRQGFEDAARERRDSIAIALGAGFAFGAAAASVLWWLA